MRLARGVLTPTKAAGDDLQVVRWLRRVCAVDRFDGLLAGVAVAFLAARGPLPRSEVAVLAHPWFPMWAVNGHPLTPDDLDTALAHVAARLEALDLVVTDRLTWSPGPSAETLLPRATALARIFRREDAAAG